MPLSVRAIYVHNTVCLFTNLPALALTTYILIKVLGGIMQIFNFQDQINLNEI